MTESPPSDGTAAPSGGAHGSNRYLLPGLAAAWLGFGLVAGSVDYWTVARPSGRSWAATVWNPVLAGLVWIAISAVVVRVVRRWPLWPARPAPWGLHLAFSLATTFVLNAAWALGAALLTSVGWPGASTRFVELPSLAWDSGLRFLHYNAGAWWVLAALVTLWDRGPGRPSTTTPEGATSAADGGAQAWTDTLPVRVGNRTRVIRVADIDWIEGAGDYARLHVDGATHLSGERLKDLEAQLDPARFARVHRSSIVNLTRVRELKHRSHGDYQAVLVDGTEVRVSRSRRAAIERLLGKG